jgi:hypothetical protein
MRGARYAARIRAGSVPAWKCWKAAICCPRLSIWDGTAHAFEMTLDHNLTPAAGPDLVAGLAPHAGTESVVRAVLSSEATTGKDAAPPSQEPAPVDQSAPASLHRTFVSREIQPLVDNLALTDHLASVFTGA